MAPLWHPVRREMRRVNAVGVSVVIFALTRRGPSFGAELSDVWPSDAGGGALGLWRHQLRASFRLV